ncbi:MAG TPA: flagellar hook-length control protein FliK [Clostridia bacterium]|nr:flagellar hook-length control protein FliK [Clostridia bacterium]
MRIDATRLMTIKPELMELLKNLEAGDVLKGRVLEALGNSIAIKTASGQVFTAILQEGASVPKGAFVELTVSSIADGKIYAEFKDENKAAGMDEKLSELLKQFRLPVDEKNMEAARLLMKYRQTVDKEAIVKITGLQKSIDNLNQSSEGRLGLLLSGLDIKNTPVDVLNKIVLNWSADMVSKDDGGSVPTNQGNIASGTAVPEKSGPVTEKAAANVVADQTPLIEENSAEAAKNTREAQAVAKPESAVIKKEISANMGTDVVEEAQTAVKENRTVSDEVKGAELLKVLDKLGIEAGSEAKNLAGKVADILASIRGSDMEALTYLASKEMKITPRNIGMLIKNVENSDGISQFLDKLQERISIGDDLELKDIKASVKKFFLEPGQLEDSKEVTEQLKDVARLGEKLEKYLNSSGSKDPEIREALSNLRDNIDFLRDINQHTNYMQLPVMINGDTSTAKLYVFKEGKKSKKIDPGDATVVVALDLSNLGHLESMIKVRDKSVNVTFRVENKSIGTMLEKNSLLLKASLKEKGYSLNPVRVINLEQPFSLLSLEAMLNESGLEKIHFDMRV